MFLCKMRDFSPNSSFSSNIVRCCFCSRILLKSHERLQITAFVIQNKSKVLDKMDAVSALLTKPLTLEKGGFATPPGALRLHFWHSLRVMVV